ncbi:MAG: PAS domain S-box protein [bacterium]
MATIINTFENLPDWVYKKWQDVADLLAETMGIPAALIMRAENKIMEVFISSHSENNPYQVGGKEKWHGLYCETVIKTQKKLIVKNATKDKDWEKNPDIKLGMIAYLGFPLNFPDGQPFGTLCVLDTKERVFTSQNEKLIVQFKNVIELDLALLQSLEFKTSRLTANVVREITDRQQAEKKLQESEKLYRTLFETAEDAILLFTDGTWIDCNAGALKVFGCTREQIIGAHPLMFSPPSQPGGLSSEVEAFRKINLAYAGEPQQFEWEHIHMDGTPFAAEVKLNRLDLDGKPYIQVVVSDVSARKLANQALSLVQSSLEAASDSLYWVKPDGTIANVNESACRLLGYTREELLHLTVPDLDAHYNTGAWASHFNELRKCGTLKFESKQRAKDGRQIPVEIVANYICFGDEEYNCAFVRDITGRKQAEDKLKASEQLYRTLFSQANEGLILLTMDGKIAELNQSFADMHGYTIEEMKNMDIKDLDVLGDGAFDQRDAVMQRIYDGETVRFEVEHYHKNGHSFFLSDTVSLITIAGQQFFLAFHQDITERKQAEERLLHSERNLKESQKLAGLGTFDLDIHAGIFRTSDILNELFGVDDNYDHSISGWAALIHPEDRDKVVSYLLNDVIGNMQPGDIEFRFVRYNDKATRWMHALGKLELHADGHPIILHGTSQDITERKESEIKILELNLDLELRVKQRTSELEAANKEMEAFSYSVSHDLKTPLRHITGLIGLFRGIKSKELNDEELGYLEIIASSASDMGKLIDAILSFSRLSSYELQKKRIISAEMVPQVIAFFNPEIQNRKITFHIEPLPDVYADEDLIRQVWINLISNAIKYTMKKPEAEIEIGSTSSGNEITFFVKDNGAGFNVKYAEKLFGVFQRLHKSSDFEGVGIGLANVNRIVKRHGGHCRAEGEPDKGATFYFSLPETAPET